ncbi:MAG: histidine phosphatase family protein [Deltaproteobacteria bacterium]|nr:histidine phosphatase family protein [Deltaproteobacteria bacterium]
MTTRLMLIRHGATTLSAEDRFAGATDVDLSDEGRRQARCLAERLASEKVAAVYASPMKRTRETASILATPHELEPILDAGLREIDHGRWEQLTRKEVEAKLPDEYASWEEDPFTFAPEGGESGLQVMARALPVIRGIVVRHPGQTVAIVSHKATIRLLLCTVLGIDPRGYRDRLDQSPACLNVVDFKDTVRARLMTYNDTTHYQDRPRTPATALSKWWDAAAK